MNGWRRVAPGWARRLFPGRGGDPAPPPAPEADQPHRRGHDFNLGNLPPGWARKAGFEEEVRIPLERLVAAPIGRRRAAALEARPKAPAQLAMALIHTALALPPQGRGEACSLAGAAQALIGGMARGGEDCRFLFDSLAAFWIELAERHLMANQFSEVEPWLKKAQQLSTRGEGEPALAARLRLTHAHLHWGRAHFEASLVEIDAALSYCARIEGTELLGAALCLKGVTLASAGKPRAARVCLQRSLLANPTENGRIALKAREALARLDRLPGPRRARSS